MFHPRRNILAFVIIVSIVCVDQITKVIARATLLGKPSYSFFYDTLVIGHAENPGAFLSLGSQFSEDARFWIFTVAVAGFILWLLWEVFFRPSESKLHDVGLSLLAGGGIGNLIDRIHKGTVTDFLNVGIGSLRTGVFNIADMAIMSGCGILFFLMLPKRSIRLGK
ncbi:MAG: signal peptidase II [Bdellovibrionaceae bacterium]|nr:signal peptidase II [Pseudobdellovibrionaceae bacterium]